MGTIPTDLRYAKSHEWAKQLDDGTVVVGISDHAQDQLGDMVYVELPEVGTALEANDACAVVESVKAASDVYVPIAGEVVAANDQLADSPETVNQDAYGQGWILKIRPTNADDINSMMDASAYEAFIASQDH